MMNETTGISTDGFSVRWTFSAAGAYLEREMCREGSADKAFEVPVRLQGGDEMRFRVVPRTCLGDLVPSIVERTGLQACMIRILCHGDKPSLDIPIHALGLEKGDFLDVVEGHGGC